MIWVLASSAGALLAWAPTEEGLPSPPANSVVRSLDAWDTPPAVPFQWNPTLLDWAVPATVSRMLSQLEFLNRLPTGSDAVIEHLGWGDSLLSASVRAVLLRFQIAAGIDPTDPRTADDAEAVAQLLAFAGHITPQQIPDVIAAALAPVP